MEQEILKKDWKLLSSTSEAIRALERHFHPDARYGWLQLFRAYPKEAFMERIWDHLTYGTNRTGLFKDNIHATTRIYNEWAKVYVLGSHPDAASRVMEHLEEGVERYAEYYEHPVSHLFNLDADFGPTPTQAPVSSILKLIGNNGLVVVQRFADQVVETQNQIRWNKALIVGGYQRIGSIRAPRAIINNKGGKAYVEMLTGDIKLREKWRDEFVTTHRADFVDEVLETARTHMLNDGRLHLKKRIIQISKEHKIASALLKAEEKRLEDDVAKALRTAMEQSHAQQEYILGVQQNISLMKRHRGESDDDDETPAVSAHVREWTEDDKAKFCNREMTRLLENENREIRDANALIAPSISFVAGKIRYAIECDPTDAETLHIVTELQALVTRIRTEVEKAVDGDPAAHIKALEEFRALLLKEREATVAKRNSARDRSTMRTNDFETWKTEWVNKTQKSATLGDCFLDLYVQREAVQSLSLLTPYSPGAQLEAVIAMDLIDVGPSMPQRPLIALTRDEDGHIVVNKKEQKEFRESPPFKAYLEALENEARGKTGAIRLACALRRLQEEWKHPAEKLDDLARFPKLSEKLLKVPEINLSPKLRPTYTPQAAIQMVLDRRTHLYNPVLRKNSPVREALLDKPVIVAQGFEFIQNQLRGLDYKIEINSDIANRIERAKRHSNVAQAPNRELEGFECLAYYDYGTYVAQANVSDPAGNPVWVKGKSYLVTPGWANRTEVLSEHNFNKGENGETGDAGTNNASENPADQVIETRRMSFQYSYWDVQTEGKSVRVTETHDRAELELENAIRLNPEIKPLTELGASQTLDEEVAKMEEAAFRLRIELNPLLDEQGHSIAPDEKWAPCLDEFIQTFPPPSPEPVQLKFEEEIKALMQKAYKRFGPNHVSVAKAGLHLNPSAKSLTRAKEIYAEEKGPLDAAWEFLPDLSPERALDEATTSTNTSGKTYRDKAGYLDRAEGRLNEIKDYQLREAAIGAFKGSTLNNSVPGSGKTLMTLMQAYLLGLKQCYVVTLTRLLRTWERECKRLNLSVEWIQGPNDAINLQRKLEFNKKNGKKPAEPEFYLVSSEWLCRGGDANMLYMPWWAKMQLNKEYDRFFAHLGAWVRGPESTNSCIFRITEARRKNQPVAAGTPNYDAKEIREAYDALELTGKEWLKNRHRQKTQNEIPLEDYLMQNLDRGWIVDAENLAHFCDTQHLATARVMVNLDTNIIQVMCDTNDARDALEETGLRIPTRSYRYESQHKKCPSCSSEKPHWKGNHCRQCGFDPRYYSGKPTATRAAKYIPNPEDSEYKVWANQPVRNVHIDMKRGTKFVHYGNYRSMRSYPGYKLLPRVDGLIVDEFHNFVSFRTLHGKSIFDIERDYTMLTSGTLCRTRTSQAEPALALVHDENSPEFPYSRHDMGLFRERFATYEYVTVVEGAKKTKKGEKREAPEASNATALRRLLHGRTIGVDEQVMEKQWGLKKINQRIITFQFQEDEQTAYQKELTEVALWRENLMHQINHGDYATMKKARKELLSGTRHQINRLKALCNGISKVNAAVEWAKERKAKGERFVMVCKSVKLWQRVRAALKDEKIPFTVIDDKSDADERDELLTNWAAGETNLLTRIKLVAEGFNQMVAATHLLFLELEDAPGHNRQMQKRLNRIGQTKDVVSDFLIGHMPGNAKTVDEASLANFLRKEKALDEITNRTARYRGPAALLNEFQAQQGLLNVLADATEKQASEIRSSVAVMHIDEAGSFVEKVENLNAENNATMAAFVAETLAAAAAAPAASVSETPAKIETIEPLPVPMAPPPEEPAPLVATIIATEASTPVPAPIPEETPAIASVTTEVVAAEVKKTKRAKAPKKPSVPVAEPATPVVVPPATVTPEAAPVAPAPAGNALFPAVVTPIRKNVRRKFVDPLQSNFNFTC